VVDVANVMGARADGWWRDRAGAALRLCREVMALAQRGAGPASAWVLVLEGRARDAVPLLADGALLHDGALLQDGASRADEASLAGPLAGDWAPLPTDGAPTDGAAPVRVVSAPGSGDDAIVGVIAELVARDESCLVVTADRELRRRCEELNASVVGPGWLLRLL
jgi:8-oxo-dGTP diphosphatase